MKYFALLIILLLAASVVADYVENITVVEEVEVPASAPIVQDALDVMVDNLANESNSTMPEITENASNITESIPFGPIESNSTVIDENVTVVEQVVSPPQAPFVDDAVEVMVEDLEDNSSQVPIINELEDLQVHDADGAVVGANIELNDNSVVIDFTEGPLKSMVLLNTENVTELPRVDEVNLETPAPDGQWAQVYAIDPTSTEFDKGIVQVVAKGTSLYKCKEWNFNQRSCDGEWKLVADDMVPGNTYYLEISQDDPAFGEIMSQDCVAEDLELTKGTFANSCDGTYPASCVGGDDLSCDDGSIETHTSNLGTYAGVQITQYNASITDCSSVTSVYLCYEWWNDVSISASDCDISVDNDAGASFTAATTTCPDSTSNPGVTCIDVTSLDDWDCSNFFGSSGTRAKIKSEAKNLLDLTGTVTWDVLYFNVSYETNSACGVISSDTTLINNVSSSGTCFTVDADNIVLDCAGYTISGDGTGYGINISSYNNLTVQNCLIENFENGVRLSASSNGLLQNNTLNSNNYGFYLTASSENNTIIDSSANGGSNVGFYVESSNSNNLINNSAASNTYDYYFIFSSNNIITGNNASGSNDAFTLAAGNNNYFSDNIAIDSTIGIFIDASSYNTIINNIGEGTFAGFYFTESSSYNNLTDNIIRTDDAWFFDCSDCMSNTLKNTTFESPDGSIRILPDSVFAIPSGMTLDMQGLNVSSSIAFLNSTAFGILNTSSEVTFNVLSLQNPEIIADFGDGFEVCPSDVCQEVSYSDGVFIFNVTHWTTYSVEEFAGSNSNSTSTEEWRMFHRTLNRGGHYPADFDMSYFSELWTFETGDVISLSSPAIADGILYTGSWDSNLHAVNIATGAEIWNYTTGGAIYSSPAVADSIVYFSSDDASVYALNATTGSLIWNYGGFWTGTRSSPAVSGGIVYVGSRYGSYDLFAINSSDGTLVWQAPLDGSTVNSAPAVVDGVVYVTTDSQNVYAVNSTDGTELWSFSAGTSFSSATVESGLVYVGGSDGTIWALNSSTGTSEWSYNVSSSLQYSSPAVANGVVFVGSDDGHVFAFNALDGSVVWTYDAFGAPVWSSPAVSDNVLFVSTIYGSLLALNVSDGSLISSNYIGGWSTSSPAIADNTVYISSSSHKVYAFGSNPPVPAPDCGSISTDTTLVSDVTSTGTCFTIDASNVVLDCAGYTITYGTGGSDNNYGIDSTGVDNITIQNCNIQTTSAGNSNHAVQITSVSNSIITNNAILITGAGADTNAIKVNGGTSNTISSTSINVDGSSSNYGVFLNSTSYNSVLSNTIITNGTGMNNWGIAASFATYSNISENNVVADGASPTDGMNLIGADNSFISLNNISAAGMGSTGVTFGWSSNSLISSNTIIANGTGLKLFVGSNNNTIYGNEIHDSSVGVGLWGAQENVFDSNLISQNSMLDVEVNVVSSTDCNNVFINNTGSGGRPINYTNETVEWGDFEASEVILCHADGSIVSNITVLVEGMQNNGLFIYASDSITLSNSNSSDNYYGIFLRDSSNIILSNNVLEGNSQQGLLMSSTTSSQILNNSIVDNNEGIRIDFSNYNNISFNNLSSNQYYGIFWGTQDSNNTIYANIVYDNGASGLKITSNSFNNTIYENILESNYMGIEILDGGGNNTIFANNISQNGDGISLTSSSGNSLFDNLFFDNTDDGLALIDSTENSIINNTIHDNSQWGINVLNSDNNTFTLNRIYNQGSKSLLVNSSSNSIFANNTINSSVTTTTFFTASFSPMTYNGVDYNISGAVFYFSDYSSDYVTSPSITVSAPNGTNNFTLVLSNVATGSNDTLFVDNAVLDGYGLHSCDDIIAAFPGATCALFVPNAWVANGDNDYVDNFTYLFNSSFYVTEGGISPYLVFSSAESSSNTVTIDDSCDNQFTNNQFNNATIDDDASCVNNVQYFNDLGLINWYLSNMSNGEDLNVPATIFLESGLVGLADELPGLDNYDAYAQIELRQVSFDSVPFLLKDGTRCDNDPLLCNITYDSETSILYANVSGFSNYTVVAPEDYSVGGSGGGGGGGSGGSGGWSGGRSHGAGSSTSSAEPASSSEAPSIISVPPVSSASFTPAEHEEAPVEELSEPAVSSSKEKRPPLITGAFSIDFSSMFVHFDMLFVIIAVLSIAILVVAGIRHG